MSRLWIKFINIAATVILLPSLITDMIPYGQYHNYLSFTAEGGEVGESIEYEASENIITINCNASFLDVVQAINEADVIENLGNGEYIQKLT